ncbi:MAG: phage tail tape measure protein [Hyphomicrobiaceae bacterium]|nr:phage tail tape measure protein [Hyphomicrobiaceae bacterium]
MAGDMNVFVRLFLKDDLSPAARKAKDALKPMEAGWRASANRLKVGMVGLKRDLDATMLRSGSGAVAGARQFEGAWLSAFGRIKAGAAAMGASIEAANARAKLHVGELTTSLHAEREAMRMARLDDYRTRPLATARQDYQAARSGFLPYAVAAGGVVAAPLLPAQRQQHASSRIKMITDMDDVTRAYFDREMIKLTERNIYDLGHTYEAAELAARLSVYEDGIKKYGNTTDGRRKAADQLVHWVDLTEQFSMMWKTMPEETSEKLKFIKNQFKLDFDGVEKVADINSALGHKFGFKQSAMVDYLVNAGAALDTFGFTPAQSIAIGSGALRKGINPSTTGTNLTQILNYLLTARSKGSAGDFKKLMGIDGKEFFDRVQADPWAAFSQFMDKAGPALKTREGRAQISKIIGSRQIRHLTQFTEAWDDIQRAYELTQNAKEVEGYATRKAKEFRDDSIENQEKTLWNAIKASLTLIGRPWVEPLKGFIQRRREGIGRFNDWMRESEEKGGFGHKAVSYSALAAGAGAGIAAGLALVRAAGRYMGYQMLAKAPGLFKLVKWPAKFAWGATAALGAGLVGGIAAGSAGIVRMLALTHRFAGAWGLVKVAARGALRFAGIGLAIEGAISSISFLIENLKTVKGLVDDIRSAWRSDGLKGTIDTSKGSAWNKLNEAVEDTWLGKALLWTGLAKSQKELLGEPSPKTIEKPAVTPTVTQGPASPSNVVPLPARKPVPSSTAKPADADSDVGKPSWLSRKWQGLTDWWRAPPVPAPPRAAPTAANDNWRADAWRRAAGLHVAPNQGSGLAHARSMAAGPAVPTLVGQQMAAGAQGQAPAGVTINAQGPLVNFKQAPPQISINAPISITMNGSDPNAVGAAVSGHLNSVARGALHDGVTE